MNPDYVVRLAIARELLVVALVERALDTLRLALLVEHPTLEHDDPATTPTLRRARAVTRASRRLANHLATYRTAVYSAIADPSHRFDDLPF